MYGYRSGIAAVWHIGVDRHFYIGMDSPLHMPQDSDVAMRLLADLQLLVMFAHDTAMRLLVEKEPPNSEAPSHRELEVLKWAAAGKTAWETRAMLSIADYTVSKHIASAMRRMNCASKSQAIARAFSMGLL